VALYTSVISCERRVFLRAGGIGSEKKKKNNGLWRNHHSAAEQNLRHAATSWHTGKYSRDMALSGGGKQHDSKPKNAARVKNGMTFPVITTCIAKTETRMRRLWRDRSPAGAALNTAQNPAYRAGA